MKRSSNILGEYVAHLACGAAMFAALLLFGVILTVLVHWAEPIVRDEEFVATMKLVLKVYHFADVVFFVWWGVFSTYKAIKEMVAADE